MRSIKTVYKTGYGPSSSHTMGPAYAAEVAMEHHLVLTCDPICGLVHYMDIKKRASYDARYLY